MEYVDNSSSEQKFSISTTKEGSGYFWYDRRLTLPELVVRFSHHQELAQKKEGDAFAPARLHGKRRKKDAVREISLLVYDIDGGQSLEAALDLIRERGLLAIVYTSYSHLKSTTSIEVEKFAEWSSRNDRPANPDQESVCEFLRSNGLDHLTGVRVMPELADEPSQQTIRIEHDPIHKFRVVFPLKIAFDAHGSGMSTDEAAILWKSYYLGIGKELGLRFDPACSGLERMFYWPSHPPCAGPDQFASVVLEGELLDYQSFKPWEPEPAQSSTKKERARSSKKHRLSGFGGRRGKTFKIADALEARKVAPILGKRPGGGLFIDCPFGGHTGISPHRTYVVNGDGDSGFVIHCSGAHCNIDGQQRDRLDYVEKMQELEWLDPADLENPEFGGGPDAVRGKNTFVWEASPPMKQAKDCVELLLQGNEAEPRLFSMGKQIHAVEMDRNTGREMLTVVSREMMKLKIDEVTNWVRMKDGDDGPTRYITTPRPICDHVTALLEPHLPLIDRIVDAPFFDADGNLVVAPGYHAASRTYYAPPPDFVLSIPEQPTSDDVRSSVTLLRDPFADFPFRDSNDRKTGDASFAHVVAMLLHPFVRLMISGPTPGFLIQKPSPGTGATLLAGVISQIAFGRPAMLEVAKTDGDEWRKSITASLLGGSSMIVFDNVLAEIKDQSIAAAITAETWSDRMLGKSQKVALPNNALWLFTGNNVTFSSELARRLVMVRLDAGVVDPTKDRDYRHPDLQKWVKSNRTALVGAILTLVQAWIVAGCPAAKGSSRLASFEDWSTVIGGILAFAEIPGFLKDRDTIKTGITDEDDAVLPLLQLMHDVFGLQPARLGRVDWNSNARSTDAQSEFLRFEPPAHLAQLVLDYSDRLSFWWLSEPKEKWGNRIGRELKHHVDRVFELQTGSGPALFTLHKHRKENGFVYSLRSVEQEKTGPDENRSDADDAPNLDEFMQRDPVADPSPAGSASREQRNVH